MTNEPDHVASSRAVYDHSAGQYLDAVGTEVSPEFEAPLDRAVLDAFAETVSGPGSGRVLDVGCGPGRVAGYLAARGLDVGGVDLSIRMIDAARSAYPGLRFDEGRLTQLPVGTHSLAAAVYWYSIIATPPPELSQVWGELDRVLGDGGRLLLAFQVGDDERIERPNAYGSATTLTLYRHDPDSVTASLAQAGFEVRADIRRQPELRHETTPQAILTAQRA